MVKETSDYRCLQSQFSVLYNESLILKAQLDETRARLNTTRTARLRQLEHMEARVWLCCCTCWVSMYFLNFIPAVCRMMRWPFRGKYVQRCFSWRTRWLRSGRSTKCCALSLNRLWLLTSKQVINAVSGNKYLQFHAVIALQSQYDQRLYPSWLIFSSARPGPINREMRHLISTLQTHNQQMKGEVVKYKIRLRETQAELNQVGPES